MGVHPSYASNQATPPVFFDIAATPDREFVWELLEAIAKLRWIKLKKPGRRAADVPPYEAEPQIILTAEGEEVIREALDRPAGQVSWRAESLAAVNEYSTLPEAWVSGFMGAARRLHTSEGVSMHVSLMSHPEGIERLVSAWTDITSALETWFFGDLDFAAVEILRALREIFPGTRAWEPDYRVLLERAKRGESQGPDEDARKGEQPTFAGETGCHFTDTRLLPFLNRCTRYVDQEAYIPDTL